MATYQWTPRAVPLCEEYDVIVVGGGPAGVAAACASAREGAKTLLIEATGALGGMSTMGMVPAWCPFSDQEKIIYRGLAERIFNEGKRRMPFLDQSQLDWVPVNAEILKVIYDELCEEFGVDVLFGTVLSDVEAANGRVNTLLVTNKAGLTAFRARVYLDCTGDADLCALAGVPFHLGDDDPEYPLQDSSHCFALGGVNDEAFVHGPWLNPTNPDSPIHAICASDKYPNVTDVHFCTARVAQGEVGFNAGHIRELRNTLDPWQLSRAYVIGRRKAQDVARALRDTQPASFGGAFVAETAPLMGVRESRRIVGDYTLTREDYIARRTFPDEIARNSYYIDVHGRIKPQPGQQELTGSAKEAHYGKGESHGIPYRCLTPQGMSNLLVAGRCISADRAMLGSVRVMPNCFTTGEAAGLAAALCARDGRSVHDVDTDGLRARLREYGAYFL